MKMQRFNSLLQRLVVASVVGVATTSWFVKPTTGQDLIQAGDLALGLGRSDPVASMEHARGPLEELGGQYTNEIWLTANIQSVDFDNLNGISHNPQGNLLGVTFSSEEGGGTIWNLPTTVQDVVGEMIGNTIGLGGDGVEQTRLGGLGVAPDNSKVSVAGYDTGSVLIYDYVAGDTAGAGASLSNVRASAPVFESGATHGTAWYDSNNVLLFNSAGELVRVNAESTAATILQTVDLGFAPDANLSEFVDVEYNPTVAPYVYASYGAFDRDTSETSSQVFIFDPANNFETVAALSFTALDDGLPRLDSTREIALGPDGTLYLGQFGGIVDILLDADNPEMLQDDSTITWYIPFTSASFSGLDVAVGLPIDLTLAGDFNEDGVLNGADIDALTAAAAANSTEALYDLNADGSVDFTDIEIWAKDLRGTWIGDANLDGEFSSGDFVELFTVGLYETGQAAVWTEGDFNGDGVFGSSDFVTALTDGGYEQGPRSAVAAVPEPASCALLLVGLLVFAGRRKA